MGLGKEMRVGEGGGVVERMPPWSPVPPSGLGDDVYISQDDDLMEEMTYE